jgi:hypothetical protein
MLADIHLKLVIKAQNTIRAARGEDAASTYR